MEGTSIADVTSWAFSSQTQFQISESADFHPGAQGVGLSALRYFVRRDMELVVNFEFSQPISPEDLQRSLIGTPFGYSIARLADRIYFGKVAELASPDFKKLLARSYKEQKGCLASGQTARSLLAIDPQFQLPPCLEHSGKHHDAYFPQPSSLANELRKLVIQLGFNIVLQSHQESPLIRFAYEVFRNSLEHGIPLAHGSESGDRSRSVRSTRSLLLEKVSFRALEPNSKIADASLKNYLARVAEDPRASDRTGILCLTIADQGDGIQSTLPILGEETDLQRLGRAFSEGVSRKPKGEVERGLGLHAALISAFELGAMIQVFSDELFFSQDFSTGDQPYPGLNLSAGQSKETICRTGTCISIYIPEFLVNPDQQSLFPSRKAAR